jgi:hypothetical protein
LARALGCPNAAPEPAWVADLAERRAKPRSSSAGSRAR